jgi:putative colanic acid biosynthesis UDP-glucose lipid carrier transferase
VVGLSSQGPVIFRQRRKGWCGRDFIVFKFRTMRVDGAGAVRGYQTQRGDARCTRVGRLLRSCSLDELPQLWNVLRGEMSLVGPRPHAESLHDIDRAGRAIVGEYAQRNRVKPGITGWAQIHGARGATATLDQLRRRVEYDLYYIDNWSLWLDLQILARTPFCMVGVNAF